MLISRPMLMGFVLLAAAFLGSSQGRDTNESNAAVAKGAVTAHSAEANDRLAEADKHFNTGRQFYFKTIWLVLAGSLTPPSTPC